MPRAECIFSQFTLENSVNSSASSLAINFVHLTASHQSVIDEGIQACLPSHPMQHIACIYPSAYRTTALCGPHRSSGGQQSQVCVNDVHIMSVAMSIFHKMNLIVDHGMNKDQSPDGVVSIKVVTAPRSKR